MLRTWKRTCRDAAEVGRVLSTIVGLSGKPRFPAPWRRSRTFSDLAAATAKMAAETTDGRFPLASISKGRIEYADAGTPGPRFPRVPTLQVSPTMVAGFGGLVPGSTDGPLEVTIRCDHSDLPVGMMEAAGWSR